jgi:hypothetical protein
MTKWVHITMVIRDDEGQAVLDFCEERLGLRQLDEDWCTHKRVQDVAALDYSPAPEPKDRRAGW